MGAESRTWAMDIQVKFLGAAESVTGSRYLITAGSFQFLFDCGLFQGLKELRLRNWDPLPVDPANVQAVILSHAHIDHCGYLPRLVKDGFNGPIYCTEATADLLEIMLLDSARLQEEQADYANHKGYSKHVPAKPLYRVEDAKRVFPLVKKFKYGEPVKVHSNVEIIFHDAGHLLGSAITEVFIQGAAQRKKLVFSGDLGRYHQDIMKSPSAIHEADVLFIESTYGNKDNSAINPEEPLARIVNETCENGGVLLIPAFAVGRTQSLLYYLQKLIREDKIPDVPVYIDSPMAISATYLYYKFPAYHTIPVDQKDFARQLETNMLVFVKTAEHSKSLNEIKRNAIIISASGMMDGGRILHHLYNRLPNKQDTVMISGYQAEGTRGRKLLDGSPTIRIFHEEIPVKCKVENVSALSGHADREELFQWMGNFKKAPKFTFAVHGEGTDLDAYAEAIRQRMNWNVLKPRYLDTVLLFENI
ncbi:MBL fold metallo-hydrolase [soil metagenome]